MTTEINKRARLVHKNFSTVKNYKTIDKGDLCSSSHTLSITFEYFDNDLSKEIAKRAPRGVTIYLSRTTSESRRYCKSSTRRVTVCGTYSKTAPSTAISSQPTFSLTKTTRSSLSTVTSPTWAGPTSNWFCPLQLVSPT